MRGFKGGFVFLYLLYVLIVHDSLTNSKSREFRKNLDSEDIIFESI